ncbi:hypothetical protein HDU76_004378 [Blyttiomyces sp. JEL0837]|nr:hypothetical protein HDU76_004378 [Blyttiomyces sp. JEL0837]
MDVSQMGMLFQASLAGDQATRTQAEEGLKLNRVSRGWDKDEDRNTTYPVVGDHDRTFVKEHIVQAVSDLPPKFNTFLLKSLEIMISHERDSWTTYMPQILPRLQSDDINAMFGALQCILSMVKIFRYVNVDGPGPIPGIVDTTFPTLLEIAKKVITMETPEAAAMLRVTLKIYLNCISKELIPALRDSSSLVPWGMILVQVVEKDIPVDASVEPEEREKQQWWKAKKWALRCLHTFIMKYCNKNKEECKEFAPQFLAHFAPNILSSYMKQVDKWINGAWMSKPVLRLLSTFIGDCVRFKTTWAVLKPHTSALVEKYIFPQLCFSKEDFDLWEEDQQEYVQRKMGDLIDLHNSASAADYLLETLVENRHSQVLGEVLPFINNLLSRYNMAPENERDARQKSGALRMMMVMSDVLLDEKKSPVLNDLETFFLQHVFTEFKNPNGFMRELCFEIIFRFERLTFAEEHQPGLMNSVLAGLQDPDLPVRVQAAHCVGLLLNYRQINEALKPHVATIMQILLALTREMDMEDLTHLMRNLSEEYPDELTPFAVDLCTQMRESFIAVMNDIAAQNQDDNFEFSSTSDTAAGILAAIASLITTAEQSPAILAELENVMAAALLQVLQSDVQEVLTDCLEVVGTFISCAEKVSPTMWQLWPAIYQAFKSDHFVFIEDLNEAVDQYIRYGSDFIAANPPVLAQILDIIRETLKDEAAATVVDGKVIVAEDDFEDTKQKAWGCILAESLMLHMKDAATELIPEFLQMALHYLAKKDDISTYLVVYCIEMVVNCLYLNAPRTIQLLDSQGATADFFMVWFQHFQHMTRVHDKKLSLLTLTAMVNMPPETLGSLQSNIGTLRDGILQLFEGYQAALEEREKLVVVDEDEDDEEEAEAVYEEDGDIEEDDDDDYEQYLSSYGAGLRIDHDQLEEDPYFTTPLDEVDPYIVFTEVLSTNPTVSALTAGLPAEKAALLNTIVTTAQQNKVKLAQAAAEQQQQQQQ